MKVDEIKEKLRKKAIIFKTVNSQAVDSTKQSWIGRVNIGYEHEELPLDVHNRPMIPLIQIH